MNSTTSSSASLVDLLQNLREATTTLFRQEVQLAKTELGEKAKTLTDQLIQIAIAGFLAFAGLIVLLWGCSQLAVVGLMAAHVSPGVAVWLGPLAVGLIVVLIGAAMFAKARKAMKTEDLTPHQTIDTLEDNARWAKNKIQNPHESAT